MCIIILSMWKVKRFSKLSSETFLADLTAAAMPPRWAEKEAAKRMCRCGRRDAAARFGPHSPATKSGGLFGEGPPKEKSRQTLCAAADPLPQSTRKGARGVRKPQKCNSASKVIQIVNKKERRGIKTPSGRKAAAHGQRLPPHTKIQGRKHPHAAAQGRWGQRPQGGGQHRQQPCRRHRGSKSRQPGQRGRQQTNRALPKAGAQRLHRVAAANSRHHIGSMGQSRLKSASDSPGRSAIPFGHVGHTVYGLLCACAFRRRQIAR